MWNYSNLYKKIFKILSIKYSRKVPVHKLGFQKYGSDSDSIMSAQIWIHILYHFPLASIHIFIDESLEDIANKANAWYDRIKAKLQLGKV